MGERSFDPRPPGLPRAHTMTLHVSDPTGIRVRDIVVMGPERLRVVAMRGAVLTVRRVPWWGWMLARATYSIRRAVRNARWWLRDFAARWLPLDDE